MPCRWNQCKYARCSAISSARPRTFSTVLDMCVRLAQIATPGLEEEKGRAAGMDVQGRIEGWEWEEKTVPMGDPCRQDGRRRARGRSWWRKAVRPGCQGVGGRYGLLVWGFWWFLLESRHCPLFAVPPCLGGVRTRRPAPALGRVGPCPADPPLARSSERPASRWLSPSHPPLESLRSHPCLGRRIHRPIGLRLLPQACHLASGEGRARQQL